MTPKAAERPELVRDIQTEKAAQLGARKTQAAQLEAPQAVAEMRTAQRGAVEQL